MHECELQVAGYDSFDFYHTHAHHILGAVGGGDEAETLVAEELNFPVHPVLLVLFASEQPRKLEQCPRSTGHEGGGRANEECGDNSEGPHGEY